MRMKKTGNTRFAYRLDKLLWFLITLLPIILYAVYLFADRSGTFVGFENFLQTIFNYDYPTGLSTNPIFKVLSSLFSFSDASAFAVLPHSLLYLLTYMASVEVIHVCFDVVVFIPRLAHTWISKAVQND